MICHWIYDLIFGCFSYLMHESAYSTYEIISLRHTKQKPRDESIL